MLCSKKSDNWSISSIQWRRKDDLEIQKWTLIPRTCESAEPQGFSCSPKKASNSSSRSFSITSSRARSSNKLSITVSQSADSQTFTHLTESILESDHELVVVGDGVRLEERRAQAADCTKKRSRIKAFYAHDACLFWCIEVLVHKNRLEEGLKRFLKGKRF